MKPSVLYYQWLAAATVLLAHIIDNVSINTKRACAVSIKNVDKLIANVDVHIVTFKKEN